MRAYGWPLLLVLLAVTVLLGWHGANVVPSGHDGSYHYHRTMELARTWFDGPVAFGRMLYQGSGQYPPLYYATGMGFLFLTRFSSWWFSLASVLFWLITALALLGLGYGALPGRWTCLLPLAAWLSSRMAWENALASNLEGCQVAGAAVILWLLLQARQCKTRPQALLAGAAAFCFALCKSLVWLNVVPAAVVLFLAARPSERRARGYVLAAIFLAAGAWLLPQFVSTWNSFGASYQQGVGEHGPGLAYYLDVLLIRYKGLPLLLALAAVAVVGGRERRWSWEDAALLLFVALPLLFYSVYQLKREWFILSTYIAVPVWFLHLARRLWDKRWVRIGARALVAFYLVWAVFNLAVLASAVFLNRKIGFEFGLRGPQPLAPLSRADMREVIYQGQLGMLARIRPNLAQARLEMLFALDLAKPEVREWFARNLARQNSAEDDARIWLWLLDPNVPDKDMAQAIRALMAWEFKGYLLLSAFREHSVDLWLRKMKTEPQRELAFQLLLDYYRMHRERGDWQSAGAAVESMENFTGPTHRQTIQELAAEVKAARAVIPRPRF